MRRLLPVLAFCALAAVPVFAEPPAAAPAPAAPESAPLTLDDVRALIQRDLDARKACRFEDERTTYTPEGKERINRFVSHLRSLGLPKNPRFAGNDGVGDINTRATFYAYRQYVTDTSRVIAALAQVYAASGVENYSALRRARGFYSSSEMKELVDQLKRFDKDYVVAKQYGPDIRAGKKVAGEKLWRSGDDIVFRDIWKGSGMADYMSESLFLLPGAFTSRMSALDRWNAKLPPSRLAEIRRSAETALGNLKNMHAMLEAADAKVMKAHLPEFASKEIDSLVEYDIFIVRTALEGRYREMIKLIDELEKDNEVAVKLRSGRFPEHVMTENALGSGEIPSFRQTVRKSCHTVESAMRHAYEDTYKRPMPMR